MKLLKSVVWRVLRHLRMGCLMLTFHPKSALVNEGWTRSFRTERSVDRAGKPIPWCTYAFIHFIEPRLKPGFRVFEYGSGSSTLWFAQRVKEVIAVEHDTRWIDSLASNVPTNVCLIHERLGNAYVEAVDNHGYFDLVVIDGRKRAECALSALKALKPMGVIIWDDSDRRDFAEGHLFLVTHGFKELAFHGMAPITLLNSRTSIMYRPSNCLEI